MIVETGKRRIPPLVLCLGLLALFVVAAALIGSLQSMGLSRERLDLLAAQPLTVQIHIGAALLAFCLGLVLFAAPKGTLPHRTLGWIWVIFMTTVAVSSLFITSLNGNAYSWIHMLSGYVLITLPAGVFAARRHKVVMHQRAMTGMFLGGMVIAGGFTFLPGRLMWRVIMG
jgi:uncharacterized membrane protein